MKKSIKSLSLGLAVVLGLAACATPNSPSRNLGNNNQNNLQIDTGVSISQQSASDLTSYYDDETTFSDSEKLAIQDSAFGTKALSDILTAKNPENAGKPEQPPTGDKPDQPKGKDKPDMKAELRADMKNDMKAELRSDMKAKLDASGAITKNANGSVTVDKDKLKATVKQFIEDHKTEIKARIEKIKDKLQDKKEVAKDKAEKLKNKKAKAKTSNVVEVKNADGSVTKTMSVEFKTDNMTKDNIISKTTLNGKMVTMSHTLKITAKAFTKEATRIVTFNADGSKKVVTESVTTFTDGRKREVHETRDIAANGSGSGSGTVAVTDKDGKNTTKALDTKITADGSDAAKVSSTETDGKNTVSLNENASGKATVAVKDGDKPEETADVDVEAKEEAAATSTAA